MASSASHLLVSREHKKGNEKGAEQIWPLGTHSQWPNSLNYHPTFFWSFLNIAITFKHFIMWGVYGLFFFEYILTSIPYIYFTSATNDAILSLSYQNLSAPTNYCLKHKNYCVNILKSIYFYTSPYASLMFHPIPSTLVQLCS